MGAPAFRVTGGTARERARAMRRTRERRLNAGPREWREYAGVVARLRGWGLSGHVGVAVSVFVSEAGARLYVAALLGPDAVVRVKRIRHGWAYAADGSVSLPCDGARRVCLAAVLHECAHVLNYRKGARLAGLAHGEAFCRTYARLLRGVL